MSLIIALCLVGQQNHPLVTNTVHVSGAHVQTKANDAHIVERGVLCTHVIAFNVTILLIILSFASTIKQMDHCDDKCRWHPRNNKKTQKLTNYHVTTNTQPVPSSYRYARIIKYILIYIPIYQSLFFFQNSLITVFIWLWFRAKSLELQSPRMSRKSQSNSYVFLNFQK